MAEISVIVPVYQAETTLDRCVRSILEQTWEDFELILVEDGSPDGSGALCDAWAARDRRIRAVHQENRGAFRAREAGLRIAGGEYVIFPDSDDWMDPGMLRSMRDRAAETGADIVTVGFLREEAGKDPVPSAGGIPSGLHDLRDRDSDTVRRFLRRALYGGTFYTPGIVPSLWSKLIRRDLLTALPPPKGCPVMGDDAAIAYPAIAGARRIAIMNEYRPYHYTTGTASLSNTWDPRCFAQADDLLRGMKESLADCPPMTEALPYYALFILGLGIDQYLFYQRSASRAEKETTINQARATFQAVAPGGAEAIDWRGFTHEQACFFQAFLAGETGKVIRLVAKKHFSGTIKAVLRLHSGNADSFPSG